MSLNGLSFSILDTISNTIIYGQKVDFKTEATPYSLLKELKGMLNKHNLLKEYYEEVTVIHKNHLYCLVPKSLFDKKELPNYLKFNAKLLANDEIAYDELAHRDMICVYVPYTNINNYLFDCFGEFEFKHYSTALLHMLFHQKSNKTLCYIHVDKRTMELVIMQHRTLLLYNQFDYETKEDFLYYLLFTYEQLALDVEQVKVKLFGDIEEGDDIFNICYKYLKKVSVFVPKHGSYPLMDFGTPTIDLTLLGNE